MSDLDDQNPISPMQSATILFALRAIAAQVVSMIATTTGKTFDIEYVNKIIDSGGGIVLSCITIYYTARAIQARIRATKVVTTTPKGPS